MWISGWATRTYTAFNGYPHRCTTLYLLEGNLGCVTISDGFCCHLLQGSTALDAAEGEKLDLANNKLGHVTATKPRGKRVTIA